MASYYWEFGDGKTSTLEDPSNTYSSAGTYTANLTVTDNDGATNTSSTAVTVSASSSGGSSGGSSSSSSGGGGGGGSTGEAFANIAFKDVKSKTIIGGLEVIYVFDDEENPIQYIKFSALRNSGKVSTTIEVLNDRSSMVDENCPGFGYSNLNIWVGRNGFATDSNIADPVIGFRVSKEWLAENGIDEDSIVLYRHNSGRWNDLNVEKVDEDASYIYFEAETPGFSPFAIAADIDDGAVADIVPIEEGTGTIIITEPSGDDVNETGSEEGTGLGLNVLFFVIPALMVIGVLYASYVVKNKREDSEYRPDDYSDDLDDDVSGTAVGLATAEDVSGEPSEIAPAVEDISGESSEITPVIEDLSDESSEVTPVVEDLFDESSEVTPVVEDVSGEPSETISTRQDKKVQPDDIDQMLKSVNDIENLLRSMRDSDNVSGDIQTAKDDASETTSDSTNNQKAEEKKQKKFDDSKW
ncbi:PGF-pre-PGF domain-containing protein [Methanococcoides sp. LMO-2]|uniref:PGF-pre-PGF domain-containing protein n=1 Tax=Methanococcoides cohabitans TaxID=3136559 RepID=A0ABU9KQC5_9EURY